MLGFQKRYSIIWESDIAEKPREPVAFLELPSKVDLHF